MTTSTAAAKIESNVPAFDVKELSKTYTTKSSMIRYLNSQGLTRSLIAKTLSIRYQHVRNVLITPIKKAK